jgi:hypothetical protein
MISGDPQDKTGSRILNMKGTPVPVLWQRPHASRNVTNFFGTQARISVG